MSDEPAAKRVDWGEYATTPPPSDAIPPPLPAAAPAPAPPLPPPPASNSAFVVTAFQQPRPGPIPPAGAPADGPTPVVHVRNLVPHAMQNDVAAAFGLFGPIKEILVLSTKNQALVEYESALSAINCVRAAPPPLVLGQPVICQPSKSFSIMRPASRQPAPGAGVVVLMTVNNPVYPITLEAIYTIASCAGTVLKIVMLRRVKIQALVEFDSTAAAAKACQMLNGHDLFPQCCTLRVETSTAEHLSVKSNSADMRDFTQAGAFDTSLALQLPAAGASQMGGAPQYGQYGQQAQSLGGSGGAMGGLPPPPPPSQQQQPWGGNQQQFQQQLPPPPQHAAWGGAGGGVPPQQWAPAAMGGGAPWAAPGGLQPGYALGQAGCIVMARNVPVALVNCQGLFNLICVYGNVDKIRFVPAKAGMVLISMESAEAASAVVTALNGVNIGGQKVDMLISKHGEIKDSHRQELLPDGTPCSISFNGSNLNRFRNPGQKMHVSAPSSTLYYFNAPPTFTADNASALCVQKFATAPVAVQQLPQQAQSKSSRGLLRFDSIEHAVDAIIKLNHNQITDLTGQIYTFKASFSSQVVN